jgi:hypothetical protein
LRDISKKFIQYIIEYEKNNTLYFTQQHIPVCLFVESSTEEEIKDLISDPYWETYPLTSYRPTLKYNSHIFMYLSKAQKIHKKLEDIFVQNSVGVWAADILDVFYGNAIKTASKKYLHSKDPRVRVRAIKYCDATDLSHLVEEKNKNVIKKLADLYGKENPLFFLKAAQVNNTRVYEAQFFEYATDKQHIIDYCSAFYSKTPLEVFDYISSEWKKQIEAAAGNSRLLQNMKYSNRTYKLILISIISHVFSDKEVLSRIDSCELDEEISYAANMKFTSKWS